ncbi:addiction module protein [Gracilimonas sp. BCB1]|uniref:addiction module protein n=1 Tax=Gracilimonas sp. BCB1 TaxID=3152362 RepID=UPI0032D96949
MRDQLIEELKALSPEEKLTVTEILWDSLKEENVSISESQLNIIREREEEYKAGNQKLYSWEEVKKLARNK